MGNVGNVMAGLVGLAITYKVVKEVSKKSRRRKKQKASEEFGLGLFK